MGYGDFKKFFRKTVSNEVLPDKHLILLKIQNMTDIFQWFLNFLRKILLAKVLKIKLCQTGNYQKNYTNQLLENLKNEKYAHLLKITFGVLILLICN